MVVKTDFGLQKYIWVHLKVEQPSGDKSASEEQYKANYTIYQREIHSLQKFVELLDYNLHGWKTNEKIPEVGQNAIHLKYCWECPLNTSKKYELNDL